MSNLISTDSIWSKLGRTEAGRRRLHQEQQQRDEKKRTDACEADNDFIDLAIPLVQATTAQIEAFTVQLDRYDTATVAALHQNAIELELVRDRIEDMLLRAHVLEDGRRVFRTEDGLQVFDEFGAEVLPDTITPVEIDPISPTWEAFSLERQLELELNQGRRELLEYQDRLDDARDRFADNEVGADELDELSGELEALMPHAVRHQLGLETTNGPNLDADFRDASAQPRLNATLRVPDLTL